MKKFLAITLLILSANFVSQGSGLDNSPNVSHAEWNTLLKKYVSPAGNVNYDGFAKDKAALDRYCTYLSNTAPASNWSRNEKMAYWINAYNAFTIQLVLKYYPVKSIRDIAGKAKAESPWKISFIKIGGKSYTLDYIENEILRPKYKDPRIHFAIVCASYSCPILRNEAYTADKLNEQLNEQTRKFVNDPNRNKISASNIKISEIFNWFKGDFTANGSVIDFLNKYSKTKINSSARTSYMNYDWSLNK